MPKGDNKFRDLTGQKFNRWTVLSRGTYKAGKIHWLCRCDCGTEGLVNTQNLKNGASKSCGCLSVESVIRRETTHGMSGYSEYKIWQMMKNRCSNTRDSHFHRYGGRGIAVCDRWENDFAAFYADMGPRPRGLTIERINNDGNYEPGNCRWATNKEQAHNKANNRRLTAFGKTQILIEWERESGISSSLLIYHLKQGTPLESILRAHGG